jgi:hypothetical protein
MTEPHTSDQNPADLDAAGTDVGRPRVGCTFARMPAAKVARQLDSWEVPGHVLGTVKPKTLRRWRETLPVAFQIIAPVDPGVLIGPDPEAAWRASLERADLLGAQTLLLQTPASFRPSVANRRLVVDRLAGRISGPRWLAWWGGGLWDGVPEDRAALCDEAGIVPALDPLALDEDAGEVPPPGDRFYWRLMGGAGMSTRFTDYDLDRVLMLAEDRTEGQVVFGSEHMLGPARRLRQLMMEDAL